MYTKTLPSDYSFFALFLGSFSFLQMFFGMKVLRLDQFAYLTEISDISSLQNLEEFSFGRCKNLLTIHDSIGFLNKLKILNAESCSRLRSFPPIKLTSHQQLRLSFCYSLENFPEILGKMENIGSISLSETSIEELPDSFQNLTGLHYLLLEGHGTLLGLPSMMPKLSCIFVNGYHLLPKQTDKPSTMVCSNVQNLTDESLPITLKWFDNMTYLDISVECIKELRSLTRLNLDDCKRLQEIRAISPYLKCLSALSRESLSSSCRNMLQNQVLFFFSY